MDLSQVTDEQVFNFAGNAFDELDHHLHGADTPKGVLGKAEIEKVARKVHENFGLGRPWNQERFETIFAKNDANGDGLVQRAEFQAFAVKAFNWIKTKIAEEQAAQ
jgi:hypothetical protein